MLSVDELKAMKDPRSPSGVFSGVQRIDVTWRTVYEGIGHQDYDTDAKFDLIVPFEDLIVRPSTHYTIWVRFKNDRGENEPGIWPNIPGVNNIAFKHKKAASRMTLNLFHEVIHIWFHYKYWWHEGQSGNTGHGKYEAPFWDEIAGTYPFYDKIVAFYKEIDKLEQQTPK